MLKERGERKTRTWAPSPSGSRLKPVGLGKRTKQSESKFSWRERERDSEVSSQQFGMT